jgi:hypothetical protein
MNDEQQTTEERPPLGSQEAIDKVREAILDYFGREVREDWDYLGKHSSISLRTHEPDTWPNILHYFGPLDFKPHPLEVIEAIRDLGRIRVSGSNRTGTPADPDDPNVEKTRAEDFFARYVAGVRRREMEQRRRLAQRRRRDAELLGLSAEESDRAQERREMLMDELESLEPPFLGYKPWFAPYDWQPDEAAFAEGKRRYLRYLDKRAMWHQQRPDVHPPIKNHNGNQLIRDFAWKAVCERRAAKICEELRALGVKNP